MQKKSDIHIFKGIKRDVDPVRQPVEFLCDALNIRMTTRGEDTDNAITPEKSTTEMFEGEYLLGQYLGHSVLNNKAVIFTTIPKNLREKDSIYANEKPDRIYVITQAVKDKQYSYAYEEIYAGYLGFNIDYPIEAFSSYENESIQKVYWTDGLNQPRVINIVGDRSKWNDTFFDFVQDLKLDEKASVEKLYGTGTFPAGVIQYCFTYYNKYAQETAIVWQSPLQYITFPNRGGSPEEKVSMSFKIQVDNVDTRFEYIRLYSILRTSLNSTPLVKRVRDVELGDLTSVNILDDGLIGDTIDPTELLYKGGETIKAETICQKDGTLFFGGITLSRPNSKDIQSVLKDRPVEITSSYDMYIRDIDNDSFYPDAFSANLKYIPTTTNYPTSCPICGQDLLEVKETKPDRCPQCGGNVWEKTESEYLYPNSFKRGEKYRLGIQFQYKTGIWSEPIYLKDEIWENDNIKSLDTYNQTVFKTSLKLKGIKDLGYKKVRPLVVFPTIQDRKIIAQGVLCPTVFNTKDRKNNSPTVQSSWYIRPFPGKNYKEREVTRDYVGLVKTNQEREVLAKTLTEDVIKCLKTYKWTEYVSGRDSIYWPSDFKFSFINKESNEEVMKSILEKQIYTYYTTNNYDISTAIVDEVNGASLEFDLVGGHESSEKDNLLKIIGKFVKEKADIALEGETEYNIGSADVLQYKHKYTLYGGIDARAEIQGVAPNAGNRELDSKRDNGVVVRRINNNEADSDSFNLATDFKGNNIFAVNQNILTFHSADIEFNTDDLLTLSLDDVKLNIVGYVSDFNSADDIMVEVSSPTISNSATGFIKNTYSQINSVRTLGSYNGFTDELIDDYSNGELGSYKFGEIVDYIIYPWQSTGSLNNDIPRTKDGGTRSAVLKRKVISDFKIAKHTDFIPTKPYAESKVELFTEDVVALKKLLGKNIYYGNIDTLLIPHIYYNNFITYNLNDFTFLKDGFVKTDYSGEFESTQAPFTNRKGNDIGKENASLRKKMSPVRMKYKSGPHAVVQLDLDKTSLDTLDNHNLSSSPFLMLGELVRENYSTFGGDNEDALKANLWIPANEAVNIEDTVIIEGGKEKEKETEIIWKWGDTYQQRYDFLKTYAFTNEDENSIIEIGSFLGEFRVNCDGRYDRNKGQSSNLNMSPTNFNLYNPVYNQQNNFFNYRILDSDFYNTNKFPNEIAWSLQHTSGEDVDKWTTVTMANTLDLDGTKGSITKIVSYNNTLYAFQDTGIAQIAFNSRAQINVSDGVPIELSNNYKVDGYQYYSDVLGAINKDTIVRGYQGIYFIDTNSKELYLIYDKLYNISTTGGMSSWIKKEASKSIFKEAYLGGDDKTLAKYTKDDKLKLWYDYKYNDLYIRANSKCLAYSEKAQCFTGFFSYSPAHTIFNINDATIALTNIQLKNANTTPWILFDREDIVANLFGKYNTVELAFYSNADPTFNKIFTNIELRADWYKDSTYKEIIYNRGTNEYDFFDKIEVSNEYQSVKESLEHLKDKHSNLKKKFRVWRIDIPRIKRDRISDTYAKIRLTKEGFNLKPFILHDLNVEYWLP